MHSVSARAAGAMPRSIPRNAVPKSQPVINPSFAIADILPWPRRNKPPLSGKYENRQSDGHRPSDSCVATRRTLALRAEFLIDHLPEVLRRLRAGEPAAVDEERRRRVHAQRR